MKTTILAVLALGLAMTSFAQADSTQRKDTTKPQTADTIKVGGVIIIRKGGNDNQSEEVTVATRHRHKPANITTNWGVVDLGFANYNDNTNYGSAAVQEFAPGTSKNAFDLRTSNSVNVNIWFFMQRVNVVKHILNLKYGVGLELNNYHYDDERIHFYKHPTIITLDPTYTDLKKNKLAADYLTIPLMADFNFTPTREKGFGVAFGVSAGYLYSARQKIKKDDNVYKIHDDFDLHQWKLAYIGEVSLGWIKLYGSYAFESMWQKALDQRPYNFGIRFSGF